MISVFFVFSFSGFSSAVPRLFRCFMPQLYELWDSPLRRDCRMLHFKKCVSNAQKVHKRVLMCWSPQLFDCGTTGYSEHSDTLCTKNILQNISYLLDSDVLHWDRTKSVSLLHRQQAPLTHCPESCPFLAQTHHVTS